MLPFGAETVTIYNRRETKDANGRTVVTWHRRVLAGCFWTSRIRHVRDGMATVLAEMIVCKIPERADYRTPAKWDALASVTNVFTLAPGDIIVRGAVTDTIGPKLTAAALVDKHKRGGVMTVTSAANNVRPGLPLGHYRAEGV